MEDKIIICECDSAEHQIIVRKFDNYVFLTVHLNTPGLVKRLIKAIKYVFGYKSKYGHFEEIVLGKDKVCELKNTLETYITKDDDN